MTSQNYRIFSDGEHVATVPEEYVEENIAYYESLRATNIDGEPIGEVTAEPYDGYVAGAR